MKHIRVMTATRGNDMRGGVAKPKRIPVRSYPCAECGTEAGDPCLRSDGQPSRGTHTSRRRMAFRAEQEAAARTQLDEPTGVTHLRSMGKKLTPGTVFQRAWNETQPGAMLVVDTSTGQTSAYGRDEAVPDLVGDQVSYTRKAGQITRAQAQAMLDVAEMFAVLKRGM